MILAEVRVWLYSVVYGRAEHLKEPADRVCDRAVYDTRIAA
jgi:hypothetical protein